MTTGNNLPKYALALVENNINMENTKRISWITALRSDLHFASAFILLLFSISHFCFLTFSYPELDMPNLVFPFLADRAVYLVAGIMEIMIGIICFKLRGQNIADVLVLTFVGLIIAYRSLFYFVGGRSCGCLGLLGHLLHVSKAQERILPLIALSFLTASTIPWLYSCAKRGLIWFSALLPCFILILSSQNVYSSTVIEVRGEINAADYNARTGNIYTNTLSHGTYVATICGDQWQISITNKNNAAWWSVVAYDGTNTFVLKPSGGNYKQGLNPDGKTVRARIRPTATFLPIDGDSLGLTIGWLTYGLSQQAVQSKITTNGLVEIPLPWEVRSMSFGYKWNFAFSLSGRFIENCSAVRDQALDLSDEAEFLRPELRYPDCLETRNEYLSGFSIRRDIPTGFVAMRYQCTKWHDCGNGILVPDASELMVYTDPKYHYAFQEMDLTATRISVREENIKILPVITAQTEVDDFRCRLIRRSKVLPSAKYTLQPGDSWKADNDLFLKTIGISQLASTGIEYGTLYSKRNVFAWLMLGLICMPALVMLWKATKTKNKK
jgi:hypothetical protein